MCGCESWTIKRAECWRIGAFELWRRPLSPLDCKEIQPVNPEGNQSWIFIGRTDAEAETSILRPPDVKNWLIGKDPDAGKDRRQEEKGTKSWTRPSDWTELNWNVFIISFRSSLGAQQLTICDCGRCSCWWLRHPCLLLRQDILHFFKGILAHSSRYNDHLN